MIAFHFVIQAHLFHQNINYLCRYISHCHADFVKNYFKIRQLLKMAAFRLANQSGNLSLNDPGNEVYKHKIIYTTALITLSILIALSNATVLLLYHINPRIRSTKNLLLVSLALSDLSAGTVVIPVTFTCFGEHSWNICFASSILFRFLAFSTMLHILAIIFEKYVSILHPFCVVQKKHLRVLSGSIWSLSCLAAILPYVWLPDGQTMDPDHIKRELIYFLVTFVCFFFLPFLLIIYAQVRMFRTISRSFSFNENIPPFPRSPVENFELSSAVRSPLRPHSGSSRETASYRTSNIHNRKVLTAFALMLGTFTVCWLSWYIGIFLHYVDRQKFLDFSEDLGQMPQVIVFMPSLVNPLLYTYYKHDFRQAFQALVKTSLKTLCH